MGQQRTIAPELSDLVCRQNQRGVARLLEEAEEALAADRSGAVIDQGMEVEPIVTHERVRIHGLLLTLKLLDWGFAEQIPEYVSRVRGWGFEYVRCRQLSQNRREFCLAALRRRSS